MLGARVRTGLRTVAGMLILLAMPAVPAADYTYSGGGGGTWDTTANGWTGASGTPWDSVNGGDNTATFSEGSPVDVTGGVFANGITFTSGTTTISDGRLLFNGDSSLATGAVTVDGGAPLADGDTFTVGLNTWQIDYAAASGGANFSGEQVAGSFVNLTAVPEPASLGFAAVAAAALLAAVRWRRSGRRTTTG